MVNFPDGERAKLTQFLGTIAPWKDAYSEAVLSIIGLRSGSDIEIFRAKMVLLDGGLSSTKIVVETKSLIACRVVLKEINESYETALEKLATCGLPTPFGTVRLITNDRENSICGHFSFNGPIFGNTGTRVNHFSLRGGRKNAALALDVVTWDLMAAKKPYGSLSELAGELSIPHFSLDDVSFVEAVADSALTIEKGKRVDGTTAELGIILRHGLKTDLCSLGYAIKVADKVIARGRIDGNDLKWQEVGTRQFGKYRLQVPKGAMVQIYAAYQGHPQDSDQIFDPDALPNYRHAMHDAFDADLTALKKYLFDEKNLQKNARDLEAGITILFFILGFSVDPLVGKPLEDAPDMIACAASGDMLLVECTTSLINKEGKLAKLVDRVVVARAKLREGPANNLRILPMIVTTRPLESITNADRQCAEEQGIVIWTKEDLEIALNQVRFPHDSDGLFNRCWESSGQARIGNISPIEQLLNL